MDFSYSRLLLVALLATTLLLSLSQPVTCEAPPSPEVQGMIDWVLGQGAVSSVEVKETENMGFGLYNTETIKSGEVIFSIPASAVLGTTEPVEEFWAVVEHHIPADSVFDRPQIAPLGPLCFWIVEERKKKDSKWQPLLEAQPLEFPSLPIFWSDEELKELAGTGVDAAVHQRKQALSAVYEEIMTSLITPLGVTEYEGVSYDDFLATAALLQSRTFSSTSETYQLVPLGDFLNHSPGPITSQFLDDGSYVLTASEDYEEVGVPVTASYGNKNNHELLLNYGFVIFANTDDYVPVDYRKPAGNIAHALAEPIIAAVDPNFRTVHIRPGSVPANLLRLFRLEALEACELDRMQQLVDNKAVSLMNEFQAFRSAIGSLTTMLMNYPTSFEEDLALLQQEEEMTENKRNAVILRVGQKDHIRSAILTLSNLWDRILLDGKLLGGVSVAGIPVEIQSEGEEAENTEQSA